MTPELTATCETLGRHDERLTSLEERQKEDRGELRSLKNWIMGTLAAACGGLVVQVIALLTRR